MATITYDWELVLPSFDINFQRTPGDQSEPAVGLLADGRFVAAWTDPALQAGQTTGLFQRRIELNGFSGPEPSLVNSTTPGDQTDASVAGLKNGGWVVSFTDTSGGAQGDVRARVFNAQGVALGTDFYVANTFGENFHSDVAALENGGFVVSWTRALGAGESDIRAMVYDAAGEPVSGILSVTLDAGEEHFSSVAGLAGGGFVVAWTNSDAADRDVYFRRYTAAGVALDATAKLIDSGGAINTDIQVAGLPDGGFVVAYTDNGWLQADGTEITARVYNADGSVRTPYIKVNDGDTAGVQDKPSLTVMSNGFFAVAWKDGTVSHAKVFDAAGAPIEEVFLQGGVIEGEILARSNGLITYLAESANPDESGDNSIQTSHYELTRSTVGDGAGESLVGDTFRDLIQGANGDDNIFGAGFLADGAFRPRSGRDTLEGGNGDDGLWGADEDDILSGGFGQDGLVGGAGNDTVAGGEDQDFLFGGDFSVVDGTFVPQSGMDNLDGGAGDDGLWGFDQSDVIRGGAGDDYVEGGDGVDTIFGDSDDDTLLGQAGNDAIAGGRGFDYLWGGAGADSFVFTEGDSYDAVWDFSAAEGDKLKLDPAFGVATLTAFKAALSGFTHEGADYSVFASADGLDQITIKGVAPAAWTAAMLEIA
jgi:Ca2+-binding RTX toxin-like protein